MILKVQAPDVHSGQYHAWVAFVSCIELKPNKKIVLDLKLNKKSPLKLKTKKKLAGIENKKSG